jgi:hypothetical protein
MHFSRGIWIVSGGFGSLVALTGSHGGIKFQIKMAKPVM